MLILRIFVGMALVLAGLTATDGFPLNPADAQPTSPPVVEMRGTLDGLGFFEVRLKQQAAKVSGEGTLDVSGDRQPVYATGTLSESGLFLEMYRDDAAQGCPLFVVVGTPGGIGVWEDASSDVGGSCSLRVIPEGEAAAPPSQRTFSVQCRVAGQPATLDLALSSTGGRGEFQGTFRSSIPLGLGGQARTSGDALMYLDSQGGAMCSLQANTLAGRLYFDLPGARRSSSELDGDSWLYVRDEGARKQRVSGWVTEVTNP